MGVDPRGLMLAALDALRTIGRLDRLRAYRPRSEVATVEPLRMSGPCGICGIDRADHERCASCGFLVGARHVYVTLADGLCDGCQADAKRRR